MQLARLVETFLRELHCDIVLKSDETPGRQHPGGEIRFSCASDGSRDLTNDMSSVADTPQNRGPHSIFEVPPSKDDAELYRGKRRQTA